MGLRIGVFLTSITAPFVFYILNLRFGHFNVFVATVIFFAVVLSGPSGAIVASGGRGGPKASPSASADRQHRQSSYFLLPWASARMLRRERPNFRRADVPARIQHPFARPTCAPPTRFY
jgi:hypothetical protein